MELEQVGLPSSFTNNLDLCGPITGHPCPGAPPFSPPPAGPVTCNTSGRSTQESEKILQLEQQSVNLGRRLIGLGRRLVDPEQNERLQRRLNPSSMFVLPLLPSDTQQLLQQANMQPDNEDDQQPSAGHYGNDY
ncbi:hypothetical protein Fmac_032776 [Flemingia macrophylla]|uniref:Uncharacterized protein n=1 Tax=Flemingia macrophylla TaxID=520843 RepID=A0ABD1L5W1_9FABA